MEKGEETHFGVKANVTVDKDNKIVTNVVVTTAAPYDVCVFVHFVCLFVTVLNLDFETFMVIYADSGVQGNVPKF